MASYLTYDSSRKRYRSQRKLDPTEQPLLGNVTWLRKWLGENEVEAEREARRIAAAHDAIIALPEPERSKLISIGGTPALEEQARDVAWYAWDTKRLIEAIDEPVLWKAQRGERSYRTDATARRAPVLEAEPASEFALDALLPRCWINSAPGKR